MKFAYVYSTPAILFPFFHIYLFISMPFNRFPRELLPLFPAFSYFHLLYYFLDGPQVRLLSLIFQLLLFSPLPLYSRAAHFRVPHSFFFFIHSSLFESFQHFYPTLHYTTLSFSGSPPPPAHLPFTFHSVFHNTFVPFLSLLFVSCSTPFVTSTRSFPTVYFTLLHFLSILSRFVLSRLFLP